MKYTTLTLMLASCLFASAQKIFNLNDIKTENLKMLLKRPIIVLEDVNSQNIIDESEKKKSKAKKPEQKKDLERAIAFAKANLEYTNKDFINDFKEIWPFDAKEITFKKFDEVKGMRKAKNNKYAIVYLREFSISSPNIEDRWMSDIAVTCLTIQASENFGLSTKVYAVPIPKLTRIEYDKDGIKLAARMLANDINYVVKTNPKGKLKDFVAHQRDKNCGKLGSVTIYGAKDLVGGKNTTSELKSAYGKKIEFVETSEITAKMNNNEADYILMPMPEYITSGSIAFYSSVAILHARVVFNDLTGEIVGWSDFISGENVGKLYLKPKHLQRIASCK